MSDKDDITREMNRIKEDVLKNYDFYIDMVDKAIMKYKEFIDILEDSKVKLKKLKDEYTEKEE